MLASISLIVAGWVASTSAACTRAVLQEVAAAYLKAQAAGQPTLLVTSPNITYKENDVSLDIAKGLLGQAVTIDFNRSLYDTVECATFTEVSAATNKHPYVVHTRIMVQDKKVASIESVVTDDGDWVFNATAYLSWTKQEAWTTIPEAQRDSRATIQAAADAYLDQWGNVSHPVPFHTPCSRLEGGLYTGQRNPASNSCAMPAFPQPLNVTNRRYVIDEELGAVDVFNDFPWLEVSRPNGTPSSNQIRVEGGKIRYIHELTVCATRNCGR